MPPKLALAIALAARALAAQTPEQRAIGYLAQEVPRWSRENGCFSCHNNGDGARALYAAIQKGYRVPEAALSSTTRWLLAPAGWDENRGDPGFSDKKLARIQFAATLSHAFESGAVHDRLPLIEAAKSLLTYQEADGSWLIDTGSVGSPATYGTALATYMARRTLEKADAARFEEPIARANGWFVAVKPGSILDAAAALLALPGVAAVRRRSLDFILPAQASSGGWGPHPLTPAEPFDTAIAMLALRELNEPGRTSQAIARGREFLIARQQPGGGWQETTRPPGAQSYAQHISTSGWAALALITTCYNPAACNPP